MSFESFLLLISSLRNQFIYFAISISLPSILLYLAEMFVILRHKQFHNTFYALILIRAIPNLLYTLDSYYCYRLTILFGNFLYPIYESFPNWMLRISYFCTFYTMLADYLATILILLNRWTAIKMPLRHKTIWRKYLPHATFTVFGLPLILYFQEFFVNAFNQIDSANGDNSPTSFFIAQDFNPIFDAFPINVIISCAFMAICIFINISTLREYRKSRQQNLATKNMAQRNQEKVESKLLAYALLTFVGHLVMAINQVLIYLVVSFNDLALIGTIYTQYPWTMDLGSVVLPSWLLFWASDSFRRQLIADFSPKWFQRLLKGKMAEITPVINLSPNGAHTIQIESQRSSENGGHIFVTRTQNI